MLNVAPVADAACPTRLGQVTQSLPRPVASWHQGPDHPILAKIQAFSAVMTKKGANQWVKHTKMCMNVMRT
jgi:hypothetical protein